MFSDVAAGALGAVAQHGQAVSLRAVPLATPAGRSASWWDLDVVPVPGPDGRAAAIMVTARDVTDHVLARREAEDAAETLAATEARLRLAQEAAGIGSWAREAPSDRLAWSPQQFRLHGLDPDRDTTPTAAQWLAMVHPDDRPRLLAAGRGTNGHGNSVQVEYRIRRADTGAYHWLQSLGRIVESSPDGQAVRVLGVNLDITERHTAEAALRASESRLRLAFAAARMFAWDWDLASGQVVWSEGAEAKAALAPGSFGGTFDAFRALVDPRDLPHVEEALRRALTGETDGYQAEFRMIRRDGGVRWTHTRGLVVRDTAGQPIRLVGVDHDITERKVAEAALRERKSHLRLALEIAGLGAWEVDLATGHAFWDGSMARLLGLSPREATYWSERWLDLIHPQDRAKVIARLRNAADGVPPATIAFRVQRPDGAERIFESRSVLSTPGRLIGFVNDVTGARAAAAALRTAEAALAQSEAQLRAMVDALPVAAWLLRADGTAVIVNDSFRAYAGEVAFQNLDDRLAFIHPEDGADALATRQRALAKGVAYDAEARARRWDGEWRWHRIRVAPVRRDPDKPPAYFVGSAVDIHDDRTLAERRGHEAAYLRLALKAARAGAWTIDLRTGSFIWSPEMHALFGLDPADGPLTLDQWLERCIHPDDRARLKARHLDLRSPHSDHDSVPEYRALHPTLGERWIECQFEIDYDDAGRPVRVAGLGLDITERRAATERQRQLLRIIEHSNDFIATAGADGRPISMNSGGRRMIGVDDHADIRDLHITDYIAPASRERFATVVLPMARDSGLHEGELQLLNLRTGAVIDVHRATFAFRDGNGVLTGYATITRDITAAKRAEAALQRSQAQLQFVTDTASVYLAHIDRDHRYLYGNKTLVRHHGLHGESIVGLHMRDVLGEAGFAALRGYVDRAFAGETLSFEIEVPYKFIGPRMMHCSYTPDRDDTGRVVGLVAAIIDVTAERQVEHALRRSEAEFRVAAEALPGLLFIVTATGHTTYVNPGLCNFTGQQAQNLLGRRWLKTIHPEDAAHVPAACRDAILAGQPFEAECRFRRHDGVWRWHMVRSLPLPDSGNAGARCVSICLDVHDRHAIEHGLRQLNEELDARVSERTRLLSEAARELTAEMQRREQAQLALLQSQKLEALGQLTGSVAHDFNNILSAILGCFGLVARRVSDPKALELIHRGEAAVQRGARLIAQLMAFVRRGEVRPEVLDPAAALRAAEDMIVHAAGSRSHCNFDIAADVWPVIADPVRLETVLLNLAANARDAMPTGGRLTVELRNARDAELPEALQDFREYIVIRVIDTGIGMDQQTLERATEPFFTTKPVGSGTGLGLASAHDLATQWGGGLRLRSAPGAGTTVELFLPRAGVVSAGASAEPDASKALHGNATILLVDDDDGVRPVTAGMLRGLGYTVIEAPSGEIAEVLAHSKDRIDMLLTDVVMPGISGPVLAANLRAQRLDFPVIYMTGYPGKATLGDTPTLRKPFTGSSLGRMVLSGLDRLPTADMLDTAAPGTARDRMIERIRTPALREIYQRWKSRRSAAGAAPRQTSFSFDDLPDEAAASSYLLRVEDAGFRFLRAGRLLEERLGRPLAGETVATVGASPLASELLGESQSVAYQRCVEARGPVYDYARFALDDGRPVLLERLLLPLADDDDTTISHLAGIALFTTLPPKPEQHASDDA